MSQITLSKDIIISDVKEFIINNFLFGDTSQSIELNDSFMEQGIIDSTGILEVINFLEDKYEVEVDDSELVPENLDSLDNISNFIIQKKSK